MAERHSIVVYVRRGEVDTVAFCDCCPPVTVEVRTYEAEATLSRAEARTVEPQWPQQFGFGLWRDHQGTYRATWYEPDADNE
jgi:hypothetical protein